MSFDFVLMAFSICYFRDLSLAFSEAKRVLKNGGSLIVGFLDRNSIIGKEYEERKTRSLFYRDANFYSVKRVTEEFRKQQFRNLHYAQTLFHTLDEIKEFEPAKPGYGEGSFVLIRGIK
jgi:ubiquinone/menaquinone biosynthesis C-methylase UbiE